MYVTDTHKASGAIPSGPPAPSGLGYCHLLQDPSQSDSPHPWEHSGQGLTPPTRPAKDQGPRTKDRGKAGRPRGRAGAEGGGLLRDVTAGAVGGEGEGGRAVFLES